MRFEIVLFLITAFLMANIYTDGKYLKIAMSWTKYYKMAGIVLGALMLYWLIKKNPLYAKQIITTSNDYLKYLPVDKNASMVVSPILDFTVKHGFSQEQLGAPYLEMPTIQQHRSQYERITQSGKKATKRSVSETKKKFVAASQNWHCGSCGKQLPAWFEVDHKIRLEYGGSNHVDNLVALCRDCHGEKTAMENL
jgi:5-methylcytosine-specific restriction endonuclease McrA